MSFVKKIYCYLRNVIFIQKKVIILIFCLLLGLVQVVNAQIMVSIPAGRFQMGYDAGFFYELPIHNVTLDTFKISETEITNEQYCLYLNDAFASNDIKIENSNVIGLTGEYNGEIYINISGGIDLNNKCWINYINNTFTVESGKENQPVVFVSWFGAKAFALYYGFDLPTEAEWEYACRGGQQYEYGTDDGTISNTKANYNNNIGHPLDVSTYQANPFGLFDMTGNVYEWCNDWSSTNYYSISPENNPKGPESGSHRVMRGGSWKTEEIHSTAGDRGANFPTNKNEIFGFRVVKYEKYIKLNSPNGGEVWLYSDAGGAKEITWSSSGVKDIKIEYNVDNGPWIVLKYSIPASDGSYNWYVPLSTPSDSALVRISDVTDPSVYDISDSYFSIRSLILISPDAGEILIGGTQHYITWKSGGVGDITIEYSIDDGLSWIYIDRVDSSIHEYLWTVPLVQSDKCKVRLLGGTLSSASYPAFTISLPSLTLVSPNGGENLIAGTLYYITWTSSNVTDVKIEYSTDGGTNWEMIVASTDAYKGSYNWIIPSIYSSNCLVRISDTSNQSIIDQSDGTFSISAEPVEPVYGTQITFSGKAKSWRADWSPDGNWIAYSEKGDDDIYKIWIVPSSGGEPVNRTGHIDGYHSKPIFTVDSKEVMFSNQGIDPNDESDYRIESIDIYSKAHRIILDNAQNGAWSHDGRYLAYRTVPGMDLYVWDTKTDKHQFIAAEDVIIYPVQTFSPDDSYIITQRDVDGEVKLFKIPTQGGQFEQITSSESNHWYPNISGNGNWILYTRLWEKEILVYNTVSGVSREIFPGSPYIIQGASFSPDGSKFCYFRENTKGSGIFEVFVADFPFGIINVMSPNGGEEWTAGTLNTISWTYENVENVKLEYSTDNGSSWSTIFTSMGAAASSYSWVVLDTPSTNCLVKIKDASDASVYDQSDDVFTILPAPKSVIVLSPNGGENWTASSTKNITWTSSGFTDVRPEYTTDNGSNWTTIVGTASADEGSYSWLVPIRPSANCKVRVSDHLNENINDVSDATFTIQETTGNTILFVAYRVNYNEIYVMNPDGSNQTRLTYNSANDTYPSWSPDGSKIAFHSYRDGNHEIYVMDADGSNQTNLTNNSADDLYPSWSPDDSKIAFVSDRYGNYEIYIMDADGSNQTRLTNNPATDECPSWSPDGSKIAFHSHGGGNREIYVINSDGSNQIRLTNIPSDDRHPSWSPDGSQIAFDSDRDDNGEIYVMNSDGSNQTNLTNNSTDDYKPSWSPDGSKIAFYSRIDGNWDIYVMNSDGSNRNRLTNNSWRESHPAWSRSVYVAPSGTITLTSPNGGEVWEPNISINITWISSGVDSVTIEYSITNGLTWANIVSGIPSATNSYTWNVPVVSSSECLVKISDASDYKIADISDSTFTISSEKLITLITPNGGEEWPVNSSQTIQWSSNNIEKVNIEYSTSDGKTWINIASDVDTSAGSYEWTVPEESSTLCKIRISDAADFTLTDESDRVFSIISSDYITVISPGSGDTWTAESTKEIIWEFNGVSNVKIELSVDNGATWQEIVASMSAATGAYSWAVPNIKKNQCFIRITDTVNTNIYDISDMFEIIKPELTIDHQPIIEAQENQEITFTAIITSSSNIDNVMLNYDVTGRRVFDNQIPMQSADGSNYSVKLDIGIFTALGMEYYITAIDVNKIYTRSPADVGFYSIKARVSDVKSTQEIKGGSIQNAYRMVSIPLNNTQTSIVDQLEGRLPDGSSGTDWRLFRFSPGISTPNEYPDIEGFSPGKAFWLITKNDFRLESIQGITVTTSEPFTITLKSGWNDISNSWMFDISWNDIENPSGANLSALYSYEGNWSDPDSIHILEPWQGYAIRNNENFSAVIKLKPNPAESSSKVVAEDENIIWKLSINASAGEAKDIANHLGVRYDAKTEWDQYDHVEPPPIGEYVSVLFPHNDWEQYPYDYTTDFRPPESTISWDFDVKTNISRETVKVTIEGIEDLPEGLYVNIFDRDTKNAIDFNNNAFNFVSGKDLTERYFMLVVSDSDKPDLEGYDSRPERFVIAKCYPNPFNPQTTLQYEMSRPGKVTISVYNAVGQEVKVYNIGNRDQGLHELVFDASNLTSGIYFYRVDAGYASVTGKMLYMK